MSGGVGGFDAIRSAQRKCTTYRQADHVRGRGAGARRARADEHANRARARAQPAHGRQAPRTHLREARRRQPDRRSCMGSRPPHGHSRLAQPALLDRQGTLAHASAYVQGPSEPALATAARRSRSGGGGARWRSPGPFHPSGGAGWQRATVPPLRNLHVRDDVARLGRESEADSPLVELGVL